MSSVAGANQQYQATPEQVTEKCLFSKEKALLKLGKGHKLYGGWEIDQNRDQFVIIFNSVLKSSIKFHLVPTLNGKMAVEADFIGILKGHARSKNPQNPLKTGFAWI